MKACLCVFALVISLISSCHAQPPAPQADAGFLDIAPDPRGAALGQVGTATSADAASAYWNPAKLTRLKSSLGAIVSTGPWLSPLVNNVYQGYVSAYFRPTDKDAVAASVNWFDVGGNLDETRSSGKRNISFEATYARALGKNFSGGLSIKHVSSNGLWLNQLPGLSASTFAIDMGVVYNKTNIDPVTGAEIAWALGAVMSNMGGKLDYGGSNLGALPATFRLGGALSYTLTGKHKIMWAADLSKLMVPTPQPGQPYYQQSVIKSMLRSFSDAPGGFSEEVREIRIGLGMEYTYGNRLAIRGGYYGEDAMKGNRKIFTVGAGVQLLKGLRADAAYWIPATRESPLARTFRVSLSYALSRQSA